jgi:hypothetical protein
MDYSGLKYKIYGGDIKSIEITLAPHEYIEANAENLIYKEAGIDYKRIKRKISIFTNTSKISQILTFLY